MPTQNRRDFVRGKVRRDFRRGAKETDPEEVRDLITFGKDSLENVVALRRHLCKVLIADTTRTTMPIPNEDPFKLE